MTNSVKKFIREISKKIIIRIYKISLSLRDPFFKYRRLRVIYKSFWTIIGNLRSKELVNQKNIKRSSLNLKKRNLEIYTKELELMGYTILEKSKIPPEIFIKHELIIKDSLDILNTFYNEKSFYGTKKYLRNLNKKFLPNDYLEKLYNYATNEIFIDIARNYLKEEPLLAELNLVLSPAFLQNSEKEYEGSQCWHSDFDDTKLLKFFIYLDDVSEDNGPLQVIPKNITKRILDEKNYIWGGNKSHDDAIYPKESNGYSNMISGKGSIIIADTVNCLHRGSRNVRKRRILLIASFYTKTSFRYTPINWLLPKPFSDYILNLSSPLIKLDKEATYLNKFALNK